MIPNFDGRCITDLWINHRDILSWYDRHFIEELYVRHTTFSDEDLLSARERMNLRRIARIVRNYYQGELDDN